MTSLLSKTAQLTATVMLYLALSPLLPVAGLMHLAAKACDKNKETGDAIAPVSHLLESTLNSAGQALVMSH